MYLQKVISRKKCDPEHCLAISKANPADFLRYFSKSIFRQDTFSIKNCKKSRLFAFKKLPAVEKRIFLAHLNISSSGALRFP
jgi:hypothetical protein